MKLRNVLLASVASWLLFSEPAQAAPVVGAVTAIAGAVVKGGLAAALFKGALAIGAQVGLSLYQRAKAKRALKNQQPRGVNVSVRTGDDNSIEIPVGKSVTPGIRAYAGTWGQAGKTPNAFFTDVLEISYLPVPGLAGMWAGDKKCTVLWNEPHSDGRGCPVKEYRSGGNDYMWVKFVDGSQNVADPFLRAAFGSHPTRPFKDTMIGRGIAYVIVTTRFNQDLFTAGKPEYLFEPSPPVFYDLRKDSTAGGNGSHRWDDRSTWEPTENNAVIIYNIVRGIYYGTEWVYGGRNLSAFRLPASNWMAAANECDRLIALQAGGTEKQFRCGMQIHGDMEPLEAVEELLKGCSGRLSECGGVFYLLIGAPGAAVYSFTDDHVVVTSERELDPFPAPDEIHNGIEATYPEPAERWVAKDAPARYDAALEAADDGHRRTASVQFRATPHAVTVQRLMEAMLKDGRRFAVHTLSLPPETKPLVPNDVIAWTSGHNGYTNKKFLIVRKSGAQGFRQVVTIKEIDPADHGWSIGMEAPTSIGHVGPAPVPPQPMSGWAVEPSEVQDADGIARRPAILIRCAPDLDDVARVHVIVRVKATGSVVFDSDQTPYPRPHSNGSYQWTISGAWCLPRTEFQAAGRYVPISNRLTEWSSWLDVLTRNILATDVSVGLGQVQNDVNQRFKDLQAEFDKAFERHAQTVLDFSLVNAIGHRQQIEMRAEMGSAMASISEERRVSASDKEALAQQITTFKAQLAAANATITEIRQAQATENSALASRINNLDAKVGEARARIEQEELTRARQDGVLAASTRILDAQMVTTRAKIVQTETTLADSIRAVAESVTGVSADLNDRFGGGLIKFSAAVDQSGVNVRHSIVMRANLGDQYKETGQYYEIYTENGVLKSRAATKVDQWVVTDGVTRNYAMVYQGGVLRLNIADIGTVYAGKMILGGGKLVIDGWYGTIEVWH
ncbi:MULTISPECIES: phage tail protein [unclassified Ensifer]|uniref:phage tail protein n=1 Tax=unclassified Ensifer TaxID=2633371 RepID=UPI0008130635|nr:MULTISPECIES: phage tail protein [unclassified Ensifer]OCP17369.1 hypothetical protein BC361_07870 [Ensifer sp. LC54]OCP28726.1 hypothetical protein BC363_02490 [Ensifer sp. LC384]